MLKPIGRSIKAVGQLRTLDEFTEEYFRDHPDEIDDYLTEIFQDFAEDNDTGALLASLRVIARVRGVSDMAEKTGMTRQGIQKALSGDGNPRLASVTSIMKAMGYYLAPQKLPPAHTPIL
jgi:probable addiction module antidote protein